MLGGILFVMKHERGFDEAGDSRCLFRMSDVGLDRTDGAVLLAVGLLSKGHRECFDFQRVAYHRAGCVAFDIADAVGADPGRLQCIGDGLRLLTQARRGVAALG